MTTSILTLFLLTFTSLTDFIDSQEDILTSLVWIEANN